MVDNKAPQHQDPEVIIASSISKFELLIEKNGRNLLIALGAIIVIVGGYFAYKYMYAAPRAIKASNAMYQAQAQFEIDSFAVALNGNASFDGFLAISDEFSGTPQANIAKHYAGICYLYMGEFQKAIDAFSSFEAVSGAPGVIVTAQNFGMMGDAYVELGDMAKGVAMYEKAAAHTPNQDTTPAYLKKAALVNESLGNNAKALEQYQTIKSNYPRGMQARDVDKFIARVQQSI